MDASDEFSKMMLDHIHRQEILAYMVMVGTAIVIALYAWGYWSGRWKP